MAIALLTLHSSPIFALQPGPQPVLVRPNIANLKPNGPEITALRTAILNMQNRKDDDPTSWKFQTSIHVGCQHGTFFFLAWHRMYLYYFERILRKASGNPNLALPYWNYATDAVVPQAFRDNSADNPLFISNRCSAANGGTPFPPSVVSSCQAFKYSNFSTTDYSGLSFGGRATNQPAHDGKLHGQLENLPHDAIHSSVGGFMKFSETAAQDPLFFVHHANIDRLWQKWVDQGHQNPINDSAWMDTQFTFYDEDGKVVPMTGRQILDTANNLGYVYEKPKPDEVCPPSANVAQENPPHHTLTWLKKENVRVISNKTTIAIPISSADKRSLRGFLQGTTSRVQVDIAYFAHQAPSGSFEVYVNLPPVALDSGESRDYYAGNLSFFDSIHATKRGQTFDITDILKKQGQKNLWNHNVISLTLFHPAWDCSNLDDGAATAMTVSVRFRYQQ
jgi:tyrosinase